MKQLARRLFPASVIALLDRLVFGVRRARIRGAQWFFGLFGYNIVKKADYYSVLPVLSEIEATRDRWEGPSALVGVDIDVAALEKNLGTLADNWESEFARVTKPGGALIVVTPAPGHLGELATLHPMRIHPDKREHLHRGFEPDFHREAEERITWTLELSARQAEAVVRMGPAAHHLTPADEQRLRSMAGTMSATAVVDLHVFRRGAG